MAFIDMNTEEYTRLADNSNITWLDDNCEKPNHSTTLFALTVAHASTDKDSVLSEKEESHNWSADTSSLNVSTSIGEYLAGASFHKAANSNANDKNSDSKHNRDGIHILIMNCQSTKCKKDEIATIIDSSEPDGIMFTETWLHHNIKNSEFLPDANEVHR